MSAIPQALENLYLSKDKFHSLDKTLYAKVSHFNFEHSVRAGFSEEDNRYYFNVIGKNGLTKEYLGVKILVSDAEKIAINILKRYTVLKLCEIKDDEV